MNNRLQYRIDEILKSLDYTLTIVNMYLIVYGLSWVFKNIFEFIKSFI